MSVGSYRVIVSYETPELEAFSLCLLQQKNCFGCDAAILENPRVKLLQAWRGQPVDVAASRQIFIGHFDCEEKRSLENVHAISRLSHPCMQSPFYLAGEEAHPTASQRLPWSWKVVCGANPAYDAFPAQHQTFYPSEKSKGALWYDPVFKVRHALPSCLLLPPLPSALLVPPLANPAYHPCLATHSSRPLPPHPPPQQVETLDGRQVWTKRHYRCMPRQVPSDLALADGKSHGAW